MRMIIFVVTKTKQNSSKQDRLQKGRSNNTINWEVVFRKKINLTFTDLQDYTRCAPMDKVHLIYGYLINNIHMVYIVNSVFSNFV
jgi:hypothetical protein